ncbi:unnamed protein product [Brassica oleracea]
MSKCKSAVKRIRKMEKDPPTTQSQYHLISNPAAPPPPQFLKQPVMNNPYGFGNIPLMPPGLPPPPPPPHMQQPQIPQSNSAQPQQGSTFQPPGIMYYGAPHHS